jgi:hypothetical protein
MVPTRTLDLPGHRSVLVTEGASGTVGTYQRHLYCLLSTLLDRAMTTEVVEVRGNKPGANDVYLDVCLFQFDGEGKGGSTKRSF